MAIQFERKPMETLTTPQRPARKQKLPPENQQIHKFWSPKIAQKSTENIIKGIISISSSQLSLLIRYLN